MNSIGHKNNPKKSEMGPWKKQKGEMKLSNWKKSKSGEVAVL